MPLPKAKALAAVADVLESGSETIVREKKDALEKGAESMQQLVGNGKDVMSVLCEDAISPPKQMLMLHAVKANSEAEDSEKLSDAAVQSQVR